MPAGMFPDELTTRVKYTHEVRASLRASAPGMATTTLDLIGGTVSWAEDRAPRVSAMLRVALPDDSSLLALLDPRLRCRLSLSVTYTLADGTESTAEVANLGLRTRRVVRPAQVLELEAVSDEALVIDASFPAATTGGATTTQTDGPGWMALNLSQSLAWIGGPDATVNRSAAPAAAAQWDTGYADQWDAIIDMADQLDLDVYDPGDRVFRIAPRPVVAGTPVHTIATGDTGTILESDSKLGREDWANHVVLAYEWADSAGATQRIWGTARVTAGPYATTAVGYKTFHDRRDTRTTQTAANKAAKAILSKLLSRSRGLTLTAVAAWWVRPGDTVTVDLPQSGTANHLVSWVDFDIEAMAMTVGTRLPDTVSTVGE